MRFMGPAQVLSRLDHALREEGARDLPERQRTLRRALDWSHDLLDAPDRLLLARLSVFAGGFTLEAAEAVGGAAAGADVLAGLGHLVSHSLVLAEAVGGDGSMRYRMLEPVRQYAAEHLVATGEADGTRLAHAEHFLALAEEARPQLEGAGQIEWLDRLAVENDNLRSAITWAVASGRPELAVRFGWSLRMFWLMRDRREEGRLLMEQALRDAEGLPEPLRARLLHVLAFCQYGFRGPLRRLAEEGVELFRRMGDRTGEEYALGMLGFALLVDEDFDEATTVLEQALAMATERGDHVNAAHLLNHLAVVPLRRDDPEAAAALAEQALARTRRTGERLARQTALQVLGQLAWSAGGDERARQLFRDALQVSLELADTVNVAYGLRGLALCDGSGGRSAPSAGLLGAADGILEQAGFPVFAWVVGGLDDAAAAAVREAAGDRAWQAAHSQGRAADLDEVVESALRT
jgi:predicted ATPase